MELCTVHIRNLVVACDARLVREVSLYLPVSPLPLAPTMVSGLLNLRGEVLPVIDGGHLIGRDRYQEEERPALLIFMEPKFALRVDRIGDVLSVEGSTIVQSPGNVSDEIREIMHAVCKLERELLVIVDVEKIYQQMNEVVVS